MTHYPRVALTFIAGEIDEIERLGGRILPIVMNSPADADLIDEDARERQRRSIYLKAQANATIGAALRLFASHPISMSRLAVKAVKSAGADVALAGRRLVHLCYAARAARECRNREIRHLHAQFGLAPATIAWFAAEILNFDPAWRCTWSFTIHGFQDFVNEMDARLELKSASASFVVCVSDFTKSQLCRVTTPLLWDRFRVVRCGIELAKFPFREPRAPGAIPRIVIVGRLSPEKGHGILLKAAKELADEGIPIEIDMVGDGPFREAIRREAEDLGITDRLIFSGELRPDDVSQHLSESDIFCMASFAEGLPISIMEAMAIGVPVVTTWIGGIPELATDEVTAITVPPGNSAALAAAIKRLLTDGALIDRIVRAARSTVECMHSREENAVEIAELFREFTGKSAA